MVASSEIGTNDGALEANQPRAPRLSTEETDSLLRSHYETTFLSQRRMPSASKQEEAIARHLASEGLDSRILESLECRESLCKLQISATSGEATSKLWGRGPFEYGGFYYLTDDGSRTIAYMGIQGHPFPKANLRELARNRLGVEKPL